MKNQKAVQKVVQNVVNEIECIKNAQDRIIEEIKDILGSTSGSINVIFDEIIELDLKKGMEFYRKYSRLEGQIDLLRNLGVKLADAGFWEK